MLIASRSFLARIFGSISKSEFFICSRPFGEITLRCIEQTQRSWAAIDPLFPSLSFSLRPSFAPSFLVENTEEKSLRFAGKARSCKDHRKKENVSMGNFDHEVSVYVCETQLQNVIDCHESTFDFRPGYL